MRFNGVAGDAALTAQWLQASQATLRTAPVAGYRAQVHQGLIASGDRFVNGVAESTARVQALQSAVHLPLAVEMEGAAVARVCATTVFPLPQCAPSRTGPTSASQADFPQFVTAVVSGYARAIATKWLHLL